MKLQTPFIDILPPLSTEEFQALKADINQTRADQTDGNTGNILTQRGDT